MVKSNSIGSYVNTISFKQKVNNYKWIKKEDYTSELDSVFNYRWRKLKI